MCRPPKTKAGGKSHYNTGTYRLTSLFLRSYAILFDCSLRRRFQSLSSLEFLDFRKPGCNFRSFSGHFPGLFSHFFSRLSCSVGADTFHTVKCSRKPLPLRLANFQRPDEQFIVRRFLYPSDARFRLLLPQACRTPPPPALWRSIPPTACM